MKEYNKNKIFWFNQVRHHSTDPTPTVRPCSRIPGQELYPQQKKSVIQDMKEEMDRLSGQQESLTAQGESYKTQVSSMQMGNVFICAE